MKILDLFCGGGGASMGMHQALEEKGIKHKIIGIDIRKIRDYPFRFIHGDVFDSFLYCPNDYDFIWASPPCQAYSTATKQNRNKGKKYPNLIEKIRSKLNRVDKPFIIENVINAPLRNDLLLCGTMFNLGVFRHRIFEIHGFTCYQPYHPNHNGKIGDRKYFQVMSGGAFREKKKGEDYYHGNYDDWCKAMGINWINFQYSSRSKYWKLPKNHPLTEAIPPAYSKYIMEQYLKKWITLEAFL